MMAKAKKKPVYDGEIDGIRIRVYSSRTEYEVVYNDDDYEDLDAHVMVYPRIIGIQGAARQGRLEYKT